MQREGVQPSFVTFVGVLKACASVVAIEEGICVHQQIIRNGLENNVFVGNCLVDMYAKYGSIKDVGCVVNKVPFRNVVIWTTMILGHVQCGQGQKAPELI
jgi:hypothetical protein